MIKNKILLASLIICLGGCILFVFRYTTITQSRYYILEYHSNNGNQKENYATSIVLMENVPWKRKDLKENIENFFWGNLTQDTINKYNANYGFVFYRETKYLTKNFKKGGQYNPKFSSWDNTMDWRNHIKDKLGETCIILRDDKSGTYICRIVKHPFFSQWFRQTDNECVFDESFDNIKDFYEKKCKELGIERK